MRCIRARRLDRLVQIVKRIAPPCFGAKGACFWIQQYLRSSSNGREVTLREIWAIRMGEQNLRETENGHLMGSEGPLAIESFAAGGECFRRNPRRHRMRHLVSEREDLRKVATEYCIRVTTDESLWNGSEHYECNRQRNKCTWYTRNSADTCREPPNQPLSASDITFSVSSIRVLRSVRFRSVIHSRYAV